MEVFDYERTIIFLSGELALSHASCEQRWEQIVKLTREREEQKAKLADLEEKLAARDRKISDLTALVNAKSSTESGA